MKRHDRDDAVCSACSKVIEVGMPISFYGSDLLHRWCSEALTAPKKPAKIVTPPARDDSS